MGLLFAYSLLPVLAVALLLFFTAVLRGRGARGLAAYCLAVALWSAMQLLICIPETARVGQRLAAIGGFIAAGYLHAAYDVSRQRSYGLVYLAYGIAVGITLVGVAIPGALYDPLTLRAGPFFWPGMVLAVFAATIPLVQLALAYRVAAPERRSELRLAFIAGVLGYLGGWTNTLLLARGVVLPFGMFLVLASLLVLANVIRNRESPADRRLLERSLLYSALAAFLSAGFLFGVLSLMSSSAEPFLGQYKLGAFFLLCMAALAFEPLRQQIQESLGRRFLRDRAPSADLARALASQEARADQAGRLAELGTFASAVAHEVRNPLGVLKAHLAVLERQVSSPDGVAAMREQIDRASHFVDDLLRYGRPRPLEIRTIDLCATADLALTTARQGLGAAPEIEVVRDTPQPSPVLEADQAQIAQVFVVLFDNALLALGEAPVKRLRVTLRGDDGEVRAVVEDSGPGVPPELAPRLFQPFVSGRKRDGPRPGTGLGLAIARGIIERHGGAIRAGRSDLGGARFEFELPKRQPVLAAAASAATAGRTP